MERQIECEEVLIKKKVIKKLYWCCVVLGFAALQPGNAIITCMQYFIETYQTANYQPQFTFPLIMFLPLIGTQILLIAFGNRFSIASKLFISMSCSTFFISIIPILCDLIKNKGLSFILAIVCLFIGCVFSGIMQSTIGGLAGAMDCKGVYMKANIIGNGISAITSNALNLICLSIIQHSKNKYSKVILLFFIVLLVIMIGCLFVAYITVSDVYVKQVNKGISREKSISELYKLTLPIFKAHGKTVMLVFIFSYIVFPGVIIAKPIRCLPIQWAIPTMILAFNSCDTFGRLISSYVKIVKSKGMMWLTLLRLLIVISICMIGYGLFNEYFVADRWILFNIAMIGITNGIGANLSMSYTIQEAKDEDRENTGKIMTIYLTGGILIGTVIAQTVFANLF